MTECTLNALAFLFLLCFVCPIKNWGWSILEAVVSILDLLADFTFNSILNQFVYVNTLNDALWFQVDVTDYSSQFSEYSYSSYKN